MKTGVLGLYSTPMPLTNSAGTVAVLLRKTMIFSLWAQTWLPAAAVRSFVLQVKPRFRGKFLYKGKVWVDTTDYAVSQVVAKPAKKVTCIRSLTDCPQK